MNAVAEQIAPASAASRRGHVAGTHARIKRSPTRNQHPAATALVTAARRLIRIAYPAASGSRPQTCARIVNSGLPGGCGMPSTYAAAMYSEVSQNCVVGARVAMYSSSAPAATRPAIRYGGRCSEVSFMAPASLVPELAHAGEHHRQAMLVGGRDHVGVLHRAA